MAFFQYLNFDGVDLPLPDSYEVDMTDKEADSGGETEAVVIFPVNAAVLRRLSLVRCMQRRWG